MPLGSYVLSKFWAYRYLGIHLGFQEVVISVGVMMGKIGSAYCGNSEIDRVLKELGRIILLVASDAAGAGRPPSLRGRV